MIKTDALIIGAGPTGLFTAHQLKLIGLNCEVVDNLDKIGGQCIQLYPDKPIYDIPAVPECTGEELTNNLINQLKPFDIKFHLSERVEEVKKNNENWQVKTNKGTEFSTPNIIIAGGVGSFEPRKFTPKDCDKLENKSIIYSIKDKSVFKGKTVSIFGGCDSALDWAIELSKDSKVNLIHRRDELRAEKILQDRLFKNPKINVIWNKTVLEFIGNDKKPSLESLVLKDTKDNSESKLSVNGAFVAIGHDPSTSLFINKVQMDEDNYIITKPDSTETSIEGIYAAGDVKDKIYRQAVTAAGMGCMAALEAEKFIASKK